jgi:hypothetical protein
MNDREILEFAKQNGIAAEDLAGGEADPAELDQGKAGSTAPKADGFLSYCNKQWAKSQKPKNGTPALLPVADIPLVMVDANGVPYKNGVRLNLEKYFFVRKGEKKARFACRYRLSVKGKQKPFAMRYFAQARYYAEQEWLKQQAEHPEN